MSHPGLVAVGLVGHSHSVALRRGQAFGGVLLSLVTLSGCASLEPRPEDYPSDDYKFGGQTGSLVPGCGVAPLSESGQALPSSDALAVIYTSDCPAAAAQELVSVSAPDSSIVNVELEPLGDAGVYLVRPGVMLGAGDYRIEVGDSAVSTLSVALEDSSLPARLGTLEAVETGDACTEHFELELTLDPAALAYVPLLRLYARVDGGSEQLLVDYGALEVREGSNLGLVRVPRCGGSCLGRGEHVLDVRGAIAGEELDIPVVAATFVNDCDDQLSASDSSASCSVSRARGRDDALLALLLASSLAALRRAARFMRRRRAS